MYQTSKKNEKKRTSLSIKVVNEENSNSRFTTSIVSDDDSNRARIQPMDPKQSRYFGSNTGSDMELSSSRRMRSIEISKILDETSSGYDPDWRNCSIPENVPSKKKLPTSQIANDAESMET